MLRSNTFYYDWVIDLSDGTTELMMGSFSIAFRGENRLPYFDPPMSKIL